MCRERQVTALFVPSLFLFLTPFNSHTLALITLYHSLLLLSLCFSHTLSQSLSHTLSQATLCQCLFLLSFVSLTLSHSFLHTLSQITLCYNLLILSLFPYSLSHSFSRTFFLRSSYITVCSLYMSLSLSHVTLAHNLLLLTLVSFSHTLISSLSSSQLLLAPSLFVSFSHTL